MALDLRSSLDRQGFVKIPGVIRGKELEDLRSACKGSTRNARAGKWPYVRTLPKQFPPWSDDASNGIWGVQHLLHPEQPSVEVFAKSYFHDIIIETVTEILACRRDQLVMELYNLLVRPDRDFALRWHRDDVGPDVPPEEELLRLQEPILHAQWNLALYDDHSLVVVDGSHKRARTDKERMADPYEPALPGQHVVDMAAGDIVFYNNNILHRGVYSAGVERMTLHGSMGMVGADPARARNILQHGVGAWAGQCRFEGLVGEKAELARSMKARLIEMGNGNGRNMTYSQNEAV